MRLTRRQLQEIILREILAPNGALTEGLIETMSSQYPELSDEISSLGPKYLQWLVARFGTAASVSESQTIEDSIETLRLFSEKEARISTRWKNNKNFREAIERRFPDRRWSTPADITTMSSDDMNLIVGLASRGRVIYNIEHEDIDIKDEEFIGKFGEWNLWFPQTPESSCKIAGFDPVTLEPKTNWCIATMTGGNRFFGYALAKSLMFYIIRDNPKSDEDWIFIQVTEDEDGEVKFYKAKGEHEVTFLTRGQNEMSLERFRQVVGSQYEPLRQSMIETYKSLNGMHPARSLLRNVTRSVDDLWNIVKTMKKKDAWSFLDGIGMDDEFADSPPSKEFLHDASLHRDPRVRMYSAMKDATPFDDLLRLVTADRDPDIRSTAVWPLTRASVHQRREIPIEVIRQLSGHSDSKIREIIALARATPKDILIALADDDIEDVRAYVATNRHTPIEILIDLASDESEKVRWAVAQAIEPIRQLRHWRDRGQDMPREVFELLAKDSDLKVRYSIAGNKHTPVDILIDLASDESKHVVSRAIKNENIPIDVLINSANSPEWIIRSAVARNKNTPLEIYEMLKDDEHEKVREDANSREEKARRDAIRAAAVAEKQSIPLQESKRWMRLAGIIVS